MAETKLVGGELITHLNFKRTTLSLGTYLSTTLADARKKPSELMRLVAKTNTHLKHNFSIKPEVE